MCKYSCAVHQLVYIYVYANVCILKVKIKLIITCHISIY